MKPATNPSNAASKIEPDPIMAATLALPDRVASVRKRNGSASGRTNETTTQRIAVPAGPGTPPGARW